MAIGDIVEFGKYPQGANGEIAPIKWRVIDVDGGKAFYLSEYGIDCRQFNSSIEKRNKWEECDLRQWLNLEFKNEAFSADENARIDGEVTCLTLKQALHYFKDFDERLCRPTDYAIERGVCLDRKNKTCDWWLQSKGKAYHTAAFVVSFGDASSLGNPVDRADVAVRPAIWVNLE